MKFFATLSFAAFIVLASTAPTSEEPSNIEVPDAFLDVDTVEGDVEKRDVGVHMDVWRDANKKGRHEGLWSIINKCYNLGNGWNDEISSVSMPKGFGCDLYENKKCKGKRLNLPKGGYYSDLRKQNFNDMISSYKCYAG